jgi:hypothetical protein
MELMHLMRQLKMEYLIANLDALCEQAAKQELDYRSFLADDPKPCRTGVCAAGRERHPAKVSQMRHYRTEGCSSQ